ncbi:MAG: 16S rRNA (cytosine(1402)-N(4))-methyltransferase RsmH [Trueperaceae bacterium]
MSHIPVMLDECLNALKLQAGHWYIDGTFGAGGHTRALLERGVNVLAIDQDQHVQETVNIFKARFGERFKFANGNFRRLVDLAKDAGLESASGILLDIGVSSMQLDNAERGFAFRQDGPLDMRMGSDGESAADIVNSLDQEELAAILYKYGEERHSRRIARAIIEQREKKALTTTQELVDIIQRAYPGGYRQDHPARRTFQALRIYVNDELGALEAALVSAEKILADEGRLVVLSYHSLEDRIVKHTLKDNPHLQVITKRPLEASEKEIKENPRARSAKLRVAEKQNVTENQALSNKSTVVSKNKYAHLRQKSPRLEAQLLGHKEKFRALGTRYETNYLVEVSPPEQSRVTYFDVTTYSSPHPLHEQGNFQPQHLEVHP